jgi:hypothetical protein
MESQVPCFDLHAFDLHAFDLLYTQYMLSQSLSQSPFILYDRFKRGKLNRYIIPENIDTHLRW